MIAMREMLPDDYPAVMRLWSVSDGMLLREADSEENIIRYLQRNSGLSFVALHQKTVVGAVLAGTDGRRGYLQHLAVDPEFQKQGIGRQLVQRVTDALLHEGIAKTHLFVGHDNKSAQAFYQNMDWQPRDEVRMFSFNASFDKNI
ncbi:GNAT family N-acetyltransferase [Oceanospirillum sp. D5]|uniref:GNAT family N-acetyltransferase n=2 Tax=Oceanospirillum sediminis TaxID=2760088 RepID=A0A839ISA5_9GAMM|nr:GNAT family N-acetyltransferase [Oceanospirillum sediminis]